MSWTYAGNPQASPVDLVHYRLGDVSPEEPIATDEECLQALTDHGGNSWLAAASIAETKAATFFNRPTMRRRGDVVTTYTHQVEGFLALAKMLRMQAGIRTASVYAGGIDQAEKDAARHDTGHVQPFARSDLHLSQRQFDSEREDW